MSKTYMNAYSIALFCIILLLNEVQNNNVPTAGKVGHHLLAQVV